MVSCVFPGSFDPVTKGHVDVIQRASRLFDHVTVTVMYNMHKKGAIPVEKRLELLRKACGDCPNVSVDRWNGLLADYMREKNEKIVIRGVRSSAEFEQELNSCEANRLLNSGMETVFVPSSLPMTGISSSAVREIAAFGGNIRAFVPEGLTEEIAALLSKKE